MLTGQQLEFLCLGFGLVFVVEICLSSRTQAPTSVVRNAHIEDVAQLNDDDLVSSRSYRPSSWLRLEDPSQNPWIGFSADGLAPDCFRCKGSSWYLLISSEQMIFGTYGRLW